MSRAPAGTCLSLIAAAALALAGCGGDDTTSTTDSVATVDAAKECLTKAGIDFREEPPSVAGVVSNLYVKEDTFHQVYVAYTATPEAATQVQKALEGFSDATGGTSGAEVVGDTIVVGRAKRTTDAEVNQVKACLTP